MARHGIAGLMFLSLAAPATVSAQATIDSRVEQMLDRARRVYSAVPPRTRCAIGTGTDIVVCAPANDRWRIPPTSETDPLSPQALNDGTLRPPDLAPRYPGVVVARGCFIPPCPGAPPYLIDLSKIPEPAPGSDADLIAQGEMRAP